MARFLLLGTMMFLQYAVLGAWAPTSAKFFTDSLPFGLNLSGGQLGVLLGCLPFATMLMPPIFGHLADKYIAPARLMGFLHLGSGGALLMLTQQHTHSGAFLWLLVHALLFAPTIALSNTVAFANIESTGKSFTSVRVMGSIGWICVGIALSVWRQSAEVPVFADGFKLAAWLSFALGIFSFLLPANRPTAVAHQRGAASELLRIQSVRALLITALVFGLTIEFYYMLTPSYLGAPVMSALQGKIPANYLEVTSPGLGLRDAKIPWVMTLAQSSEIFAMILLPFFIRKWGIRTMLTIGLACVPLRFAAFAFLPTPYVVFPALLLHGVCFTCFVVSGFIYMERVASDHSRATAQALMTIAALGLGKLMGSLIAGATLSFYTVHLPVSVSVAGASEVQRLVDWQTVYMIPCALSILMALIFPFIFKEQKTLPKIQESIV